LPRRYGLTLNLRAYENQKNIVMKDLEAVIGYLYKLNKNKNYVGTYLDAKFLAEVIITLEDSKQSVIKDNYDLH
jgi:hypothetical protein